jgi:hypothetical protein
VQPSPQTSLVATLAAHHASGEVAAVQFANDPEVELVDTGERLPVDDFFRRYPAGVVIHWHAPRDRR